MVFVDPYMLTLCLVCVILMIFGNIYFLAHYSHHADSFFGSSALTKVILSIGYILAEMQILMIAMDVQNTNNDLNIHMTMFWLVITMTVLFYICTFLPFGLFYSEVNEERDFKWRMCQAMRNEVILWIIVSIILFPAYVYARTAYIPVTASTCLATQNGVFLPSTQVVSATDSKCLVKQTTLAVEVGFPVFAITVMTTIGWFLLCFFLTTGMWAYPFNWIGAWVGRPIPMKEDEFNRAKQELAQKVQKLLAQGKELLQKKTVQISEEAASGRCTGCFSNWFKGRKIQSEQTLFETNCMVAEKEFQKLDRIAAYNERVEPCYYFFLLIAGILFAIFSVLFMVHIFMSVVLLVNGKTSNPFFNTFLYQIETSPVAFLTPVIFVVLGYYFFFCAWEGQIKFGLRFFFVTFYPLVPKETFANSFMANCIILNLFNIAVTQFVCQCFDGYIVGTSAALIWNVQVRYMNYISWVFVNNFFIIWAIVWWFIAFIYFCLKPVEKMELGIGAKRADLSSKQ